LKGRLKRMDINDLLTKAGGWELNADSEEVMGKIAELLYEEFQKMTPQEFKQHLRREVKFEKSTREFVIQFAFQAARDKTVPVETEPAIPVLQPKVSGTQEISLESMIKNAKSRFV